MSLPVAARLSPKHPAALLCVTGVVLRMLAVPAGVGDVDSVNHARALAGFDPLHQAPHFPGYPVYTAATHVMALLPLSDAWTLALPGILLFAVAAPAFYGSLAARVSAPVALSALGLSAIAPVAVAASAWPSSDGFGFSWLLLCVALVLQSSKRASLAAALCIGLGLGVRLSYAPALLALLTLLVFYHRDLSKTQVMSVAALGVVAWALPMILWVGPRELWALATGFTSGHFQEFGGSAFAGEGQSARLARITWSLWDAGLGAAFPFAIPDGHGLGESQFLSYVLAALFVVSFAGMLRAWRLGLHYDPTVRAALLLGAPYLLWLYVAQNPDKPRHLLPLLPVLGMLFAHGLQRVRHGLQLQALLLMAMAAVTLPRALEQGFSPVPAVAVAERLQAMQRDDGRTPRLVLAGPESRLLQHRLPSLRVLRPLDYQVAMREARRARRLGVEVLMTSTIAGMPEVPMMETLLDARFDESVRPQDARIVLFRANGAPRATEHPTLAAAAQAHGARGW